MFRFPLFFVMFFALLPIAPATTVLLLKEGGTLEGELLNPNELSRKSYRIKTAGGLEINLDAKLVDRVQSRERPALVEYHAKVHLTENTVDNHLFWAKWCTENQLLDQSRLHWQQVLELDSDHAEARRVLGYERTPNGWVSQQSRREDRGLISDRGRWRTAQQIEVESILTTQREAEAEWRRRIRDLVRRLPNSEGELLAIRDPAAVRPLGDVLLDERNPLLPHARMVLLRSIAGIPHSSAVRFVVGWSILPTELDEIRQMCVEELLRLCKESPEVRQIMIDAYRKVLSPTSLPPVITLVAKVLEDLEAHEAVPELIGVLVVMRQVTIQTPPTTYGTGPSGMSLQQGGGPIRRLEPDRNQAVLAALIKLTGWNFQFDQARWLEQYRQTQRAPSFNLRRDL